MIDVEPKDWWRCNMFTQRLEGCCCVAKNKKVYQPLLFALPCPTRDRIKHERGVCSLQKSAVETETHRPFIRLKHSHIVPLSLSRLPHNRTDANVLSTANCPTRGSSTRQLGIIARWIYYHVPNTQQSPVIQGVAYKLTSLCRHSRTGP